MSRTLLSAALFFAACDSPSPAARLPAAGQKLYVACQDVPSVEVLDARTLDHLATLHFPAPLYYPHNVQVAPDARSIWVTSIYGKPELGIPDQVMVIDPMTDQFRDQVDVDVGAYVAHVVLSPDSKRAYASGMMVDRIYQIDAATLTRLPDIELPHGATPHGIRLSADGSRLYVAEMNGNIAEIDTLTAQVVHLPVVGPAVQVAVGTHAVYAAITNPPSVARFDLATRAMTTFPFPAGTFAFGQDYLTPDGSRVYVAEQGSTTGAGYHLFGIDGATGSVVASISVPPGAHGIVLTADGQFAFVTSMYANQVSTIDLPAGTIAAQREVGQMPMGVTLWTQP